MARSETRSEKTPERRRSTSERHQPGQRQYTWRDTRGDSPFETVPERRERTRLNTMLAVGAFMIVATMVAAFIGDSVFDRAFTLTWAIVQVATPAAAGAFIARQWQ